MTDEQLIKKMQELPIVGQDYPCYQHNRIKKDYRDIVIINKIVPFNEADKRTLKEWNEMVKERPDLFAQKTDYFIYGTIPKYKDYDKDKEDYWHRMSFCVYVRSDDNTWESLTDAGGLLDVTGGFLRKFEDSFLMSREQIEERWEKQTN